MPAVAEVHRSSSELIERRVSSPKATLRQKLVRRRLQGLQDGGQEVLVPPPDRVEELRCTRSQQGGGPGFRCSPPPSPGSARTRSGVSLVPSTVTTSSPSSVTGMEALLTSPGAWATATNSVWADSCSRRARRLGGAEARHVLALGIAGVRREARLGFLREEPAAVDVGELAGDGAGLVVKAWGPAFLPGTRSCLPATARSALRRRQACWPAATLPCPPGACRSCPVRSVK